MKLHSEKITKFCHYLKNCKKCPFEEHGCFLHKLSKECMYSQKCERKLCPYRHSGRKTSTMDLKYVNNVEESDMENNYTSNEEVESFAASTPRKRKFDYAECNNQSQCIDCFVRQTLLPPQTVHFAADV